MAEVGNVEPGVVVAENPFDTEEASEHIESLLDESLKILESREDFKEKQVAEDSKVEGFFEEEFVEKVPDKHKDYDPQREVLRLRNFVVGDLIDPTRRWKKTLDYVDPVTDRWTKDRLSDARKEILSEDFSTRHKMEIISRLKTFATVSRRISSDLEEELDDNARLMIEEVDGTYNKLGEIKPGFSEEGDRDNVQQTMRLVNDFRERIDQRRSFLRGGFDELDKKLNDPVIEVSEAFGYLEHLYAESVKNSS